MVLWGKYSSIWANTVDFLSGIYGVMFGKYSSVVAKKVEICVNTVVCLAIQW